MIRIEMNTSRLKLTVKGHAQPEETDDRAFSAICTAVSAVTQSMIWALSRFGGGDTLDGMEYRRERGDLMVRIRPEDGMAAKVTEIFTLFGYGLELLAKSHPESVTMVWDGAKILPDEEMKNK